MLIGFLLPSKSLRVAATGGGAGERAESERGSFVATE